MNQIVTSPAVEQVMGRAVMDATFRTSLLSNPEGVLNSLHLGLTDAEIQLMITTLRNNDGLSLASNTSRSLWL